MFVSNYVGMGFSLNENYLNKFDYTTYFTTSETLNGINVTMCNKRHVHPLVCNDDTHINMRLEIKIPQICWNIVQELLQAGAQSFSQHRYVLCAS